MRLLVNRRRQRADDRRAERQVAARRRDGPTGLGLTIPSGSRQRWFAGGGWIYAAILAAGGLVWWLSAEHPALLPFWVPWDFSPPQYLLTALVLLWFFRGLGRLPPAERPPVWRRAAFLAGIAIIWTVLQTRFEYWSQHMFFLNRIQAVAIAGPGPFLVALGGAGPALGRGMPARLQRVTRSAAVAVLLRVLQQPLVAALLYVGLFYFWLIPAVHLRAMIDRQIYGLMNWSMALAGLLFWCIVLDPRPRPPARISYGTRIILAFGVMFPQIALGALITFSRTDLYPSYELCGRLFPSIDALADQHTGGIVIWIPPAMMSVLAVVLVIDALRLHEEAASGAGASLGGR